MNRLLTIILFSFFVLSGHAQQFYRDALLFDAKGNIESINYKSGSSLPTPAIIFGQNGAIHEIFQQQAINDTWAFSTPMPIDEIIRDNSDLPILIKFKTQQPHSFTLDVSWNNCVSTEFKYVLVYNTKFIKELDNNGLVIGLKLYAVLDDSDNWIYAGMSKFSNYSYDENGNWIKRTVTLFDENNVESNSYIEERCITYFQ